MSINCTLDCKYQLDGLCSLEELDGSGEDIPSQAESECVYYQPHQIKAGKTDSK